MNYYANNHFMSWIMQDVVFCISGIQNPERGRMVEMGVRMGAIYKPLWDYSCTHLICAFENTPKLRQARGRAIIVNRNWINDCYAMQRKLPWQNYRF